jgi:DNA-binding transcriptional ArsR family regulator
MEGLVEAKKEGQFVAYEIKDLRTLALMKSLFDIFCHSQTTKVLKAGGIEK